MSGAGAELLEWARAQYSQAGKSPGREVFTLWAHVCAEREFLFCPRELNAAQEREFRRLVLRRVNGEPLQHLLGRMWFYGLELESGPGCFVVRPETERLVELCALASASDSNAQLEQTSAPKPPVASPRADSTFVAPHSRPPIASPRPVETVSAPPARPTSPGLPPVLRIADLCSGSGAIALALAQNFPSAHVWAVEKSPAAAAYAKRNLERYPALAARISYELADATSLDLWRDLSGTFDLVATNPPYVPVQQVRQAEALHDPPLALYGGGPDGLEIPLAVGATAARLLRSGGILVMEHDDSQGPATVEWALAHGFGAAHTETDLAGKPRFLLARRA